MKRKTFLLKSLTVLSMCGGLLGVTIGFISIIDLNSIKIFAHIPGYTSIYSLTKNANQIYPYLKVILYILSFYGALSMFMLKKRGFLFYTCAQIFLLLIPYFLWNLDILMVFFTDLPDLIFTIAFVAAYTLYLPNMTAIKHNGTNEK